MSESPGMRRLDAEEVNRMASDLDGQPYRAEAVDDDSAVGTVPDAARSIEAEFDPPAAGTSGVAPGDGPSQSLGGSVEDRAILREEETP